MAKYRKVACTSCEDILFNIYTFIVTTSSESPYRLVNDTGTAVALFSFGTGFVSTWGTSANCPDGSYLVIEPATALGGIRHQIKITNAASNTLQVQFSTRGGWTNAGAAFGASSKTDATQWNDANAPGAGSECYMGVGTFAIDGSNTGSFFWCNIRDTGSAGCDQYFYCGNYYPWDITYDVNPVCFLARVPNVVAGTFDLNRGTADGNNLNRTSVEVAQTTSLSAAGYARIGLSDATGITPGGTCILRDLQSYYPPLPAYLFLRNSAIMGHFGDHLRICTDSLSDYDTGTTADPATRLVLGQLWVEYDESL